MSLGSFHAKKTNEWAECSLDDAVFAWSKKMVIEERDEPKFEVGTPILNVKDVPKSIDYYTAQLGFQLAWDWGEPAIFACVYRGKVSVFLCQESQGAPGTWLYVGVDDVDRVFGEYEKSGAIIVQRPTNFPWGNREMNVEDLDGHRIRIASEATGESDGVALPE